MDKLSNKNIIILIFIFLAYSIGWSYISLARIYSLNAYIGDLGFISESSWMVFHMGYNEFINTLFSQAGLLIYAIAILFGKNMYEAMVIIQTIWLGAGVFPIYLIANKILKNQRIALLLAISYLVYFPLSGINWFDVHRQALFPTLFMASYYFYIRGDKSKYLALFLMIFSSMLRFPYEIFPLWFGITLLLEYFVLNSKKSKKKFDFYIGLTLVCASLFLIGYNLGLFTSTSISLLKPIISITYFLNPIKYTINEYLRLQFNYTQIYSNYYVPPIIWLAHINAPYLPHWIAKFAIYYNQHPIWFLSHYIYLKGYEVDLLTIILILAPVLFMPLFSWRWAPALIPMILLIFFSSYWGYHYPKFFEFEYPSIIIAPVWLGTIEGISFLSKNKNVKNKNNASKKIVKSILLISILFGLFFTPYGPLNHIAFNNYELNRVIDYNLTYFNEFLDVLSFIPKNASYIAATNNIPEIFPRPYAYKTLWGFQYYQAQYIIINILNPDWLLVNNSGTNPIYNGSRLINVFQETNWALNNGYGILAEEGGTMLLKKGYNSSIIIFKPYSLTYSNNKIMPINCWIGLNDFINNTNEITCNSSKPVTLFIENEPIALLPGTYNITYYLMSKHLSNSTKLYAVISGYLWEEGKNASFILLNKTIDTSLISNSSWTPISFEFPIRSLVVNVSITIETNNMNGELLIDKIKVVQLYPYSIS